LLGRRGNPYLSKLIVVTCYKNNVKNLFLRFAFLRLSRKNPLVIYIHLKKKNPSKLFCRFFFGGGELFGFKKGKEAVLKAVLISVSQISKSNETFRYT